MTGQIIIEKLRNLEPSGPDGFEGLVRDMFEEVTGRSFRLMKSGHQHGRDLASSISPDENVIYVEAKKFKETSNLTVKELCSKLDEVIQSENQVDLWVIAASKEIPSNTEDVLREKGHAAGIEIVVLDWRTKSSNLSPLQTLVGLCPNSLDHHLKTNVKMKAAISSIMSAHDFQAKSSELKKLLTSSLLGYDFLHVSAKQYLQDKTSNLKSAKAKLGSRANVTDPVVKLIPRKTVQAGLAAWQNTDKNIAVLLGKEGYGKTWAAISWLLEEDEGQIPIFLPARQIASHDAVEVIADEIAEITGITNDQFWKSKLSKWVSKESDKKLFKIVIDGINQVSFSEWRDLISSFQDDAWHKCADVLFTDRPNHWRSKTLDKMDEPATEIKTGKYNDTELNDLLEFHNLERSDFNHCVIELLKVPRLFSLVLRQKDKLDKHEIITREWLMLREWRDQLSGSASGEKVVSDEAFHEVIRDLAQKSQVKQGELLKSLLEQTGEEKSSLRQNLSDIVDGQWLSNTTGQGNFKISSELQPMALALSLHHELTSHDEVETLNLIHTFLDPFGDTDETGKILASAVSISFGQKQLSDISLSYLFSEYINHPNTPFLQTDPLMQAMISKPRLIFDLLEDTAHQQGLRTHNLDQFSWVIFRLYESDVVQPIIIEYLNCWMQLSGTPQGHPDKWAPDEQASDAEWWAAIKKNSSEGMPPLIQIDWNKALPLYSLALKTIQELPKRPFAEGISSRLYRYSLDKMQRWITNDISYLLRFNNVDNKDTHDELIRIGQSWQETGNKCGEVAANTLFKALGSHEADELIKITVDKKKSAPVFKQSVIKKKKSIDWCPEGNKKPLEKDASMREVRQLADYAADPNITLCKTALVKLKKIGKGAVNIKMQAAHGTTTNDLWLEAVSPALSRWAPMEYAEIIRSNYAGLLSRKNGEQSFLSQDALQYLTLLSSTMRTSLATKARKKIGKLSDVSKISETSELAYLDVLDKPMNNHILSIAKLPTGTHIPKGYDTLLRNFSLDEDAFNGSLKHMDNHELRLSYLGILEFFHYHLKDLNIDIDTIISWLKEGNEQLRSRILRVGYFLENKRLNESIIEAYSSFDWRTEYQEKSGDELSKINYHWMVWSLIYSADNSIPFSEMIDQLHEDVVHNAIDLRNQWKDDLPAWLEWLKRQNESKPKRRTRVMGGEVIIHPRAYSNIVENLGDSAEELGNKCIKWVRDTSFSSRFWTHDILRDFGVALAETNPELSLEIWKVYHKLSIENNYSSSDIYRWPFKGDALVFNDARKLTMQCAQTDAQLFDVSVYCQKAGASDWLINYIQDELKAAELGRQARAIQIAGYLDKSNAADVLWKKIDAIPTISKWLSDIRKQSSQTYVNNTYARHWFEEFLNENDWDTAIGAYNLFLELVDNRFNVWASAYKPWEKEGLHYHHYLLTHHMINARNKKLIDGLKKTYCGMKIPYNF